MSFRLKKRHGLYLELSGVSIVVSLKFDLLKFQKVGFYHIFQTTFTAKSIYCILKPSSCGSEITALEPVTEVSVPSGSTLPIFPGHRTVILF